MRQPNIPGVSTGAKKPNVRVIVVSSLAELIRRVSLGDIGPRGLAEELRRLAATVEGKGPQATDEGPQNQEMLDTWKRIFFFWQKATDRPTARPTNDRRSKVLARLRAGYSEADIRAAIVGCVEDEWHAENKKTDLVYICQSDSKLESFREMGGGVGVDQSDTSEISDEIEQQIAELEDEAMTMLTLGNTEAYERIQAKIASLGSG